MKNLQVIVLHISRQALRLCAVITLVAFMATTLFQPGTAYAQNAASAHNLTAYQSGGVNQPIKLSGTSSLPDEVFFGDSGAETMREKLSTVERCKIAETRAYLEEMKDVNSEFYILFLGLLVACDEEDGRVLESYTRTIGLETAFDRLLRETTAGDTDLLDRYIMSAIMHAQGDVIQFVGKLLEQADISRSEQMFYQAVTKGWQIALQSSFTEAAEESVNALEAKGTISSSRRNGQTFMTVKNGDTSMEIRLTMGMTVMSFKPFGKEVFYHAGDTEKSTGTFIMAPFVQQNAARKEFWEAIRHGDVRASGDWIIESVEEHDGAIAVRTSVDVVRIVNGEEWNCTVTETYTIRDGSLTMSFAIKNNGESKILPNHGYHHIGIRPEGATLRVDGQKAIIERVDELATGELKPIEGIHALADTLTFDEGTPFINDSYRMRKRWKVDVGYDDVALTFKADSPIMHVWTGDEKRSVLAIEPLWGPANAQNLFLDGKKKFSQLKWLKPGKTFSGTFSISAERKNEEGAEVRQQVKSVKTIARRVAQRFNDSKAIHRFFRNKTFLTVALVFTASSVLGATGEAAVSLSGWIFLSAIVVVGFLYVRMIQSYRKKQREIERRDRLDQRLFRMQMDNPDRTKGLHFIPRVKKSAFTIALFFVASTVFGADGVVGQNNILESVQGMQAIAFGATSGAFCCYCLGFLLKDFYSKNYGYVLGGGLALLGGVCSVRFGVPLYVGAALFSAAIFCGISFIALFVIAGFRRGDDTANENGKGSGLKSLMIDGGNKIDGGKKTKPRFFARGVMRAMDSVASFIPGKMMKKVRRELNKWFVFKRNIISESDDETPMEADLEELIKVLKINPTGSGWGIEIPQKIVFMYDGKKWVLQLSQKSVESVGMSSARTRKEMRLEYRVGVDVPNYGLIYENIAPVKLAIIMHAEEEVFFAIDHEKSVFEFTGRASVLDGVIGEWITRYDNWTMGDVTIKSANRLVKKRKRDVVAMPVVEEADTDTVIPEDPVEKEKPVQGVVLSEGTMIRRIKTQLYPKGVDAFGVNLYLRLKLDPDNVSPLDIMLLQGLLGRIGGDQRNNEQLTLFANVFASVIPTLDKKVEKKKTRVKKTEVPREKKVEPIVPVNAVLKKARGKKTVLLFDITVQLKRYVKDLEHAGYRVLTATRLADARLCVQENDIDLVMALATTGKDTPAQLFAYDVLTKNSEIPVFTVSRDGKAPFRSSNVKKTFTTGKYGRNFYQVIQAVDEQLGVSENPSSVDDRVARGGVFLRAA